LLEIVNSVKTSYIDSFTNEGMKIRVFIGDRLFDKKILAYQGLAAVDDGWWVGTYATEHLSTERNGTHVTLTKTIFTIERLTGNISGVKVMKGVKENTLRFSAIFDLRPVTVSNGARHEETNANPIRINDNNLLFKPSYNLHVSNRAQMGSMLQFEINANSQLKVLRHRAQTCEVICASRSCSGQQVTIYGENGSYCPLSFVNFQVIDDGTSNAAQYSYLPFKWVRGGKEGEVQVLSCVVEHQFKPFEAVDLSNC